MPPTVRLKYIVDALEMQFDESSAFLDLDTRQVETVSHALLREAEDPGDEEPDLPTLAETRMGDCQANRFYRPLPEASHKAECLMRNPFATATSRTPLSPVAGQEYPGPRPSIA